jgi:hypothetical protein
MVPEIAFTGDTMADFIVDKNNEDVLKAKVLIMEVSFASLFLVIPSTQMNYIVIVIVFLNLKDQILIEVARYI